MCLFENGFQFQTPSTKDNNLSETMVKIITQNHKNLEFSKILYKTSYIDFYYQNILAVKCPSQLRQMKKVNRETKSHNHIFEGNSA